MGIRLQLLHVFLLSLLGIALCAVAMVTEYWIKFVIVSGSTRYTSNRLGLFYVRLDPPLNTLRPDRSTEYCQTVEAVCSSGYSANTCLWGRAIFIAVFISAAGILTTAILGLLALILSDEKKKSMSLGTCISAGITALIGAGACVAGWVYTKWVSCNGVPQEFNTDFSFHLFMAMTGVAAEIMILGIYNTYDLSVTRKITPFDDSSQKYSTRSPGRTASVRHGSQPEDSAPLRAPVSNP